MASGRERSTWRDRYPDEVTCVRCLEIRDLTHLDRMLWCDLCRAQARNRAGWWGWLGGLAFGACIAAFIWIGIQPSDLIVGAWAGTVVAAIWLGSKVSRELAYGVMRFRNTHAADAVPPDTAEEGPLA